MLTVTKTMFSAPGNQINGRVGAEQQNHNQNWYLEKVPVSPSACPDCLQTWISFFL